MGRGFTRKNADSGAGELVCTETDRIYYSRNGRRKNGAYLKASQDEITRAVARVVRGNCWLLEKDAPRKEVEIGQRLSLE